MGQDTPCTSKMVYRVEPGWPCLAWLAVCDPATGRIEVRHGPRVECHEDWFCEAVWAGEYSRGDFDKTDLVFGSGGRCRDGGVVFVPSGSAIDRLHTVRLNGSFLISNSLPCILSVSGAGVDACYTGYFHDFRSISWGLNRYLRDLQTTVGPVRLTYFNNVVWNGNSFKEEPKPEDVTGFKNFEAYDYFLESSINGLAKNMASSQRRYPYRLLGTLSTGYDSPMISAVGKRCGLEEVVTFRQGRGGTTDDGSTIAKALGLRAVCANRDDWRTEEGASIPFIAANANGEEVHFSSLSSHLLGRVVLTGYNGDKVWSKDSKDLGPDIVRGDHNGLSQCEFRLWAGFINCPVTFLGIRRIADIVKISNSQEMEPWDVGGAYNRPICRRIVETAGVPRGIFGISKRLVSASFWDPDELFFSNADMENYYQWLRDNASLWKERGLVAPLKKVRWENLYHALYSIPRTVTKPLARFAKGRRLRRCFDTRREAMFHPLFPWAIERAKRRYLQP